MYIRIVKLIIHKSVLVLLCIRVLVLVLTSTRASIYYITLPGIRIRARRIRTPSLTQTPSECNSTISTRSAYCILIAEAHSKRWQRPNQDQKPPPRALMRLLGNVVSTDSSRSGGTHLGATASSRTTCPTSAGSSTWRALSQVMWALESTMHLSAHSCGAL